MDVDMSKAEQSNRATESPYSCGFWGGLYRKSKCPLLLMTHLLLSCSLEEAGGAGQSHRKAQSPHRTSGDSFAVE